MKTLCNVCPKYRVILETLKIYYSHMGINIDVPDHHKSGVLENIRLFFHVEQKPHVGRSLLRKCCWQKGITHWEPNRTHSWTTLQVSFLGPAGDCWTDERIHCK